MEIDGLRLRPVTPEDAPALLELYAPYVTDTAITFEYDVPTAEDFAGRIRRTLERYPYLAAERDGAVVGYAYAGAFHPRAAYDWAAETSIYVRRSLSRSGVGGRLYRGLELCLSAQGITNLCACIACPTETEDEYLTGNSLAFHAHFGYRMVGRFRQCGYKFGRWYDMAWMEKHLSPHLAAQPPVRPFQEVWPEVAPALAGI